MMILPNSHGKMKLMATSSHKQNDPLSVLALVEILWMQLSSAHRWSASEFVLRDLAILHVDRLGGGVLGGELPTNRFCGLVHPSYKWTTCPHLSHL